MRVKTKDKLLEQARVNAFCISLGIDLKTHKKASRAFGSYVARMTDGPRLLENPSLSREAFIAGWVYSWLKIKG